ncbi:MAG: kelch repeat-containing protein [Segetibacter sp.]
MAFGGYGNAPGNLGDPGHLNDLWKYNISTNQWTWMKGDSTANHYGVYGTQGLATPANKPGSRLGSISWSDRSGNLWLFGGDGYAQSNSSVLNDLWRYNISTNQWTWVKGDSTVKQYGVYGTQGIEAAANKPGARIYSISWTDLSGNLWLFGGHGGHRYTFNFGDMNDLWRYNISRNQWTWMKGDSTAKVYDAAYGDSTANPYGVYGTQGIAAAANQPGSRVASISWTDLSGNLWLFGGDGCSAASIGYLNDLWKYSVSDNRWTWVQGDTTVNALGVYGVKGIPGAANKPGARDGGISWIDLSGNLFLFGGYGLSAGTFGHLNDLWEYNISNNQWTWVKGDSIMDVNSVYGTQGIASAANKPGGRWTGVSWTDLSGNLWLFGGFGFVRPGFDLLNDLWKLNNAPALPMTQNGQEIIVYPTVTNGHINIKLPPGFENIAVRVLNMIGQEMIVDYSNTSTRAINLSAFADGIYLVQAGDKRKIFKTTKVMLIR